MTRKEYKNWINKADNGLVADEKNPAFILNCVDTELLAMIISGKIDIKALAKLEMENRGRNADGAWVGFGKVIA